LENWGFRLLIQLQTLLKNPEGVLEPLSAADKVLAKLAEAKK
jgi:hypothetical protein